MRVARSGPLPKCLLIVLAVLPSACGLTLAATGDGPPTDDAGALAPALDATMQDANAISTDDASDARQEIDASDAATISKNRGALHLSSTNVQDGVLAGLAIPDAFTIEAWIRIAALPTGQERYVLSRDQQFTTTSQFRFGVDTAGRVFFAMSDSTGQGHELIAPDFSNLFFTAAAVPLNVWTHVAVTHDGAVTSLYVDGVMSKTITSASAWVNGSASNVPVIFGARVGGLGGTSRNGSFDGDIDDLRVYRVKRTQANIAADRDREVGASDADYTSLVAYMQLDDGSGTKAVDATGGSDAALEGAPTWLSSGAF